jgi:hypothetical protein
MMKSGLSRICLALAPLPLAAAQPWQEVTTPTVADVAAAFPKPPAEYGAIHWAIWGGQQSKEKILADIENAAANGAGVYMIDNSRGLRPKYFTPEYLDLVKFAVDECAQHGLKVWIEGDAGYPDGFAGGMISKDYPSLGMQGIVADAQYSVAAGQTLRIPVPVDTIGILAVTRGLRSVKPLPIPADGQFVWTAPDPGGSEVVFIRHVFRSSPTRYTNRADGTADKDSLYSIIDYLNPDATRTYLKLIFDTYQRIVGDKFVTTVLGFRGDETDYTGFMPWTPKLLETFKERKGYDLQPYIAQFFEPELSPEAQRAKADYWDVWSSMFRDNFYKVLADWCQGNGLEYMSHMNHEETMLDLPLGEDLIRNEGSFFRNMRYTQVPGIDNLNQIGPGIVADFPKLASDAAHVYGHPHVWAEEGGGPTQSGKFVADYQLVRGVNYLNVRGLNTAPDSYASQLINSSSAIGWYVTRAGYLLTVGRPAAQVALIHPDDSMWMSDEESNRVTVGLTTELMEHQVDFDATDPDGILYACTLEGGTLKNLSGQVYRAVVVPSSSVISRAVLDKLRAFASAGGKVIFVGSTPTMVYDKTFLDPEPGAPDLSFATLEPTPHITDAVIAALPVPDVKLDSACPGIKYIHRTLGDGDVYFFLNESGDRQVRTATLDGHGQVQEWDATTGAIHPMAGVPAADGTVAVPLVLEPYESRFVVIGPVPASAGGPAPTLAGGRVVDLDGDWSISWGDRQATGPLQTWEQLGVPSFKGVALYKKDFTVSAPAAGQRVYLDLGNVHEVARIRVNGTEFAALPWPPYVWDVTAAVKDGANSLEVDVQVPQHEVRRGYGMLPNERRGMQGAPGSGAGRHGISPTGVPGGLTWNEPFQGMNRARNGFMTTATDQPPASGLLGPVKVIEQ